MKKVLLAMIILSVMLTGCSFNSKDEFKVSEEEIKKESWDLSELYKSNEDFNKDYNKFKNEWLVNFKARLKEGITEDNILDIMKDYDSIYPLVNKLDSYPELLLSIDASDNNALDLNVKGDEVEIIYLKDLDNLIRNELIQKDETFWTSILNNEKLAPWRRQLEDIHTQKKHTPSSEINTILLTLSKARSLTENLYNTLLYVDLKYDKVKDDKGKDITANSINRSISVNSKNRDFRKRVDEAFFKTFKEYSNTFASNLYNHIKLGEDYYRYLNYSSTFERSMNYDEITPTIYNNLIKEALENIDIVEESYNIKKKILKFDDIYIYDSYLNIGTTDNKVISYSEGKEIIKNALEPLGDKYLKEINRAFNEHWIDAYPKENKNTGAFQANVTNHPYISTCYTNDFDGVSDLIHELGHAVHSRFSQDAQESNYNKNYKILISEAASTTNEILLIHYYINNAKTDDEKLTYLFKELDFIKAAYFRQLMFASFEKRLHDKVLEGNALSKDTITKIFKEEYDKFYPGQTNFDDMYYSWCRISHFYNDFYVYRYSLSVAGAYEIVEKLAAGDKDAIEAYYSFLKSGDSLNTVDTYKLIGFDITKDNFTKAITNRSREILREINEIVNKKK